MTPLRASHPDSQPATKAARPSTIRPRRILIDCTPTFRSDCGTGVQRVVRNLVNCSASAGRQMRVACEGVAYDAILGFQKVSTMPGAGDAAQHPGGAPAFVTESAARTSTISLPMLRGALRRTLTATGLIHPARRVNRTVQRTLAAVHHAASRRSRLTDGVHPGAGDVLLLTDTIWNTPEVWDGVRQAVSRGATLGAIVYDLIPLRFGDLYGTHFEKIFGQWFENVTSLADFVLCISQSVWNDVQAHLATHGTPGGRATELLGGWFRLGEGLDAHPPSGSVRPQLRQLFGKKHRDNPYLIVGSFDPRKDLATVIMAFERLWQRGSEAQLVTIGRGAAGHPSPLEQAVLGHAQHGRKLFCFHDVHDGELDFCYRNSAALITASYAEGFNLPIVESLSRGRPVLASDIPVHREVAGSHAAYFRPRAAAALAELILRYERGELGNTLARLDGYRWPNWLESSRELIERIGELYGQSVDRARLAG